MQARSTLSLLWSSLRFARSWTELLIGTLASAGHLAAQLSMPWIIGLIIDDALIHGNSELLLRRSLLLAAAAAISVLCQGAWTLAFNRWSEKGWIHLCQEMLQHLHRLPVDALEGQMSGKLSSLFTNDARKLVSIYHPLTKDVIYCVLQILFLTALISWKYTDLLFLAAVLIPLYLIYPLLLTRKTRLLSRRIQEDEAEVSSRLQEVISGAVEIKALAQGEWNLRRVLPALRDAARSRSKNVRFQWFYSTNYVFYWSAVAFVYWRGGAQVLTGELSIGGLVALVSYLGYLEVPVSSLLSIHSRIQTLAGPLQRVSEYLTIPEEQDGPIQEIPQSPPGVPLLELRNVTFRFPGRSQPALDRIDLRIEQGEKIALVGPSGAGKTTLARLLLRFYDPSEGSIHLQGVDLRQLDLSVLRSQTATVFQDPFLFSSRVADNIGLARTDATPREIEEAARNAQAHGFILTLQSGYDTVIGERGSGLSGGQKQRIAVARAILKASDIVILDEATSALDALSEHQVHRALEQLLRDRTAILIAHRLATVARADRIVVLEEGRIVGVGPHLSLLESCPLYRRLCELSLITQNEESPPRLLAAIS